VKDLVYIDEYGLLGSNFYWKKGAEKGLTQEELIRVGVTDERVQVSKDIIAALVAADKEFQEKGYKLYLKEGYRPKALYELVYEARMKMSGDADRVFNMNDMPHATGKSIDVGLWDIKQDEQVHLRKNDDGTDALFVDFYRHRTDEEGKRYQELQDYLKDVMLKHGFEYGIKNEYFHFNYVK